MKQIFLKKTQSPELLLFCSGWGADDHLFNHTLPPEWDYLICFDYRELRFDYSLLKGYSSVRLLGWSMGVWAAEQVFAKCQDIPWSYKLAFNGTPRPIDDLYGIPDKIFATTTENFSPLTLVKFRRRMCGGTEGVKQFLSHQPYRSLEELGTELKELQKLVKEHKPDVSLTWDKVIVGTQDKIIPTKNQQRYWKETSATIEERPMEHYDELFFKECLGGNKELWTKS